jgi:hypothetical protein
MRDQTKVIIGFGCIWGLFAFGAMLMGAFMALMVGYNGTAPGTLAMILYGLTVLPSCIIAIWYRRISAIWLIVLSFIAAFGFVHQDVYQSTHDKAYQSSLVHTIVPIVIAAIPGLLGVLLLRSVRDEITQPTSSVLE